MPVELEWVVWLLLDCCLPVSIIVHCDCGLVGCCLLVDDDGARAAAAVSAANFGIRRYENGACLQLAGACRVQRWLRADESRRWTDGFHFPPNLCHVYVF